MVFLIVGTNQSLALSVSWHRWTMTLSSSWNPFVSFPPLLLNGQPYGNRICSQFFYWYLIKYYLRQKTLCRTSFILRHVFNITVLYVEVCLLKGLAKRSGLSQIDVECNSSSPALKSWKDVALCPTQPKAYEKAEHYQWLRTVKNILLLELHLDLWPSSSQSQFCHEVQVCGLLQVFAQADRLAGKEPHTVFITYLSLSWCTLLRDAWPSSKIFTTKLRNTASHRVKVTRD